MIFRKKNVVFFSINSICIIILCQTVGGAKKLGLYEATDPVTILDHANFDKNVVGSETAWIVEFYNTWCGHCIHFAPKWKQFGNDMIAWRPVLGVGAVDCAERNNTDLCRKYNVHAFPSFKLFPPHVNASAQGSDYNEQRLDYILNKVTELLSNTTTFKIPRSWPKVNPLDTMQDIWKEVKEEHKFVAFVFEKPDSYIGRQVILDTFQYRSLLVRRMTSTSVAKYGITTFPSLYLINKDGTFTQIAKNNFTREGMTGALLALLSPDQRKAGHQYDGNQDNKLPITMEIEEKEQEPVADTQDTNPGVYMQDLESTLHYSFRQEIAIHRDMTGTKLTALKHFVKVLAKVGKFGLCSIYAQQLMDDSRGTGQLSNPNLLYFPGRELVTSFLEKVTLWLQMVGTELTGDEWLNSIDELQTVSVYLPERIEWVGCQGSEARYRGYPCGLWTLFHTLTVSAYQTNRENPRDLPLDVLGAIKGYMEHFFGCQTCVDHFLKQTATITTVDNNPRGATLWLWRTHNKVNNRLHGVQSEDPKHPKIQFPPKSLCQKCFTNEGEFKEDEVFTFFVSFYGKDGIVVPEEESKESFYDEKSFNTAENKDKTLDWWELQQRKKDLEKIHALRLQKHDKNKQKKDAVKNALAIRDNRLDGGFMKEDERDTIDLGAMENRPKLLGWGFSNIDMGMCFVFYVLCTVIILVLYYHFIVRRKYRPWKIFV